MRTVCEDEVYKMQGDVTKADHRLNRFEVVVTGLEARLARVDVDVVKTKSDVSELRACMEGGFRVLRTEMHKELAAVLQQMRAESTDIRREMSDGFDSVRKERFVESTDIRQEMRHGFLSLREKLFKTKELVAFLFALVISAAVLHGLRAN